MSSLFSINLGVILKIRAQILLMYEVVCANSEKKIPRQNLGIFAGKILRQNPKSTTIEIAEKRFGNLLWKLSKCFLSIPNF